MRTFPAGAMPGAVIGLLALAACNERPATLAMSAAAATAAPPSSCTSLCGVGGYNLFVLGDANAIYGDVEGAMGVGGNATLDFHSIGNSLVPPVPFSLEVAGNLTFHNGSVRVGAAQGTAVYGGTLDKDDTATANFVQGDAATLASFYQQKGACLKALAADLAAMPANCTAEIPYGNVLKLSTAGVVESAYCSVSAATLQGVGSIDLSGVQVSDAATANVVLSVSGQSATLNYLGYTFGGGLGPKNFLLNFYEATTLQLNGSVEGSTNAPYANVTAVNGQYVGNLFAGTFSGQAAEPHNVAFVACPPPTCGSCDDQNPCTTDSCVNGACVHDTIPGCCRTDGECADTNPCTTDACVNNTCVHSPTSCNDNDVCTTDTCDPASGCVYTPIQNCCTMSSQCNDGNACTTDTCESNTCVHGTLACDDGNACTADSCDPAVGCKKTNIVCNDNNACTNDGCDPATGCVHAPKSCDDNNACTVDSCDPATGCVHAPKSCDDTNPCTADACDPATGCKNTPIAGCCLMDSQCNDNNVCTDDRCVNNTCQHTNNSNTCNDGNACTSPDLCVGGTCTGYTSTACAQGCTPGYWKNKTKNWVYYRTTDKVKVPFPNASMSEYLLGDYTLLQGLSFQGGSTLRGAAEILLRAAIAALLNARKLGASYPLTDTQVRTQVNAALASKDRSTILSLATQLDGYNNAGCPLN